MLKGKLVTLRPLKKTDARHCMRWMNDRDVSRYLVVFMPVTETKEEHWVEAMQTSTEDVVFIIEVRVGGRKKPIGTVGLHGINWKDREVKFGIAIGEKSFWGRGYGTEAGKLAIDYAFNTLNMHRISSFVYAPNIGSLKIHEKIGFKKEGTHRKQIFIDGEYHDVFSFGFLRGDIK